MLVSGHALVGLVLISIDGSAFFGMVLHEGVQGWRVGAFCSLSGHPPVMLLHAGYSLLANRPAPGVQLLVLVLVFLLAANVRSLQRPQSAPCRSHPRLPKPRLPNPVSEEPGGLLSDPKLSCKLRRGNTLAGRSEHVDRQQPGF